MAEKTQKSVEKGVEQRIYQRLTQVLEIEDIPNLPKWISKTIEKGEDDLALKYVDYLIDHLIVVVIFSFFILCQPKLFSGSNLNL